MGRSLRTAALAGLLGLAAPARGHEVLVEAGPSFTAATPANPRTGSFQVRAEAVLEPTEASSVFASGQYTRDLATRTEEASAGGADLFLLGLGATWAPDERWLTLVSLTGSPPALQRNATTVTAASGQTADVVVASRSWFAGGLVAAFFTTGHDGPVELSVDARAGLERHDVFQQLELGTSPRATLLRTACQARPRMQVCTLLAGVATPLLQGRLGATGTLTLQQDTDLSLSVDGLLYDRDPDEVGYFSLAALGSAEVGAGVPLLPLALSVRPSVVQRWSRFTVRAAYQLGLYVNGGGTTHALTAKGSLKVSEEVTLWLSATAQFDATGAVVHDPGGSAQAGALISW